MLSHCQVFVTAPNNADDVGLKHDNTNECQQNNDAQCLWTHFQ